MEQINFTLQTTVVPMYLNLIVIEKALIIVVALVLFTQRFKY